MRREDLTVRMHRAGLRLDDAALAAQIAITAHQHERDRLIIAVSKCLGLTSRKIGRIFGLSHVHICRVLRQELEM